MSKYPCGLIQDIIPLYLEGDVSDETKEIVKEHLKDCISCSSLMNEYSNDELKLDEYKEDLPHAKTFKKLMKRLKIWGSIIIVAGILVAITIGVVGYKIGEQPTKDILTLASIVKTFEKQGLPLKEDKLKSPDNYILNGVKPFIFSVGKDKDTILIYTFNSFVEREAIAGKDSISNAFSLQKVSYNAKNTYLVYIAAKVPKTDQDMSSITKTKDLISNIVFKYLNDGKEVTYKGDSTSWSGTVTLKYYEHWWKDPAGVLNYESYNTQDPVIKYRMSNKEAVGPIDFEYETTAGGGKLTGAHLNKEGYLDIGGGGSNGAMPRRGGDINFTIRWAGKEENIVLKAQ